MATQFSKVIGFVSSKTCLGKNTAKIVSHQAAECKEMQDTAGRLTGKGFQWCSMVQWSTLRDMLSVTIHQFLQKKWFRIGCESSKVRPRQGIVSFYSRRQRGLWHPLIKSDFSVCKTIITAYPRYKVDSSNSVNIVHHVESGALHSRTEGLKSISHTMLLISFQIPRGDLTSR